MKPLASAESYFELLSDLGASPWLLRHHELVVEAARLLCDRLERDLGLEFDRHAVLVGAALHDVGKIVHPEETQAPGHEHEAAGRDLLTRYGVPPNVARGSPRWASRNSYGERGSLRLRRGHVDLSSVRRHNLIRDVEPEASGVFVSAFRRTNHRLKRLLK